MNKAYLSLILLAFLLISTPDLIAQATITSTFGIINTSDDAEESLVSGSVNLGSSDLEMVLESEPQIIGIRFANVTIPAGVTIESAFIQFTVDETDDVETNLTFQGELVPNSETFAGLDNNIISRPITTASVNWDNIPAWNEVNVAGPDQRTPDLKSIVTEIISQDGWESGNAMTFIVTDGVGVRNAISRDKSEEASAKLIITFTTNEFIVESFPFSAGALWKYNDQGMDLGTAWTALDFDDSAWAFGAAQLGYGDGDEVTELSFGPDSDNKYPTYYFRKKFRVEDAASIEALTLELLRDDGAVVYINGTEVIRDGMPSGDITYNTFANSTVGGDEEDTFFDFEVENNLTDGENILAVEIHQTSGTSSDISFDLALVEGELPDFVFIEKGDMWSYDDSGMDLDTSWRETDFDDMAWATGNGKFGYGDNNETTTLDFGGNPDDKHITYYFRKTFNVENPTVIGILTLGLLRDDGAVVYINGTEVLRDNMPEGEINFETLSTSIVSGVDEITFFEFEVSPGLLVPGENTIAVEVHQRGPSSSDLGFDMFLFGSEVDNPLVQLIHNSPDPSLAFADIYVDAFSLGNFVKINGSLPVPFRCGSGFLDDLPPGTHRIAVSPFGQEDFEWSIQEITLEGNKEYMVLAEGVRDPSLFNTTVNGDAIGFRFVFNEVPGTEGTSPTETLALLHHGAPDVPNIRFIAVGAGDATGDLPEGLPYGFPILGGDVDALPYPIVQVTDNTSSVIYQEVKTDLVPFAGQRVLLFTSGFDSPEGNTGVNDRNFGTYLMPGIEGCAVELPAPDPAVPGKIQIIHNSPDPDLAEVDIYLNGEEVISNLGYRNTTGYVDIPAGPNRVAVSPSTATEADTAWSATTIVVDSVLNTSTFRFDGQNYVAVAFGARNTAPFENEVNADVNFGIAVAEARLEAFSEEEVSFIVHHGSTDAPEIDAIIDGQFIPVVNNLGFGNFTTYFSLPADNMFQLNLTDRDDNNNVLFAYELDLTGLGGAALTVLASGPLAPAEGIDPFGLFVTDGTEGPLTPLSLVVGTQEAEAIGIELYPNPTTDIIQLNTPVTINQVQISNVHGKVFARYTDVQESFRIPTTEYPAGLYLLQIEINGEMYQSRFIKQ